MLLHPRIRLLQFLPDKTGLALKKTRKFLQKRKKEAFLSCFPACNTGGMCYCFQEENYNHRTYAGTAE
ncbi:MAG: hypothetical protein A2X49_01410 [Lentisphaerae bacterium GWF2_52_8]|nr:MAG: hypothetical protein A2X49_01410 [Lentisphaerae bacterium GWF2_52_8]